MRRKYEIERWARATWSAISDPADNLALQLVNQLGAVESLEKIIALTRLEKDPSADTIRQAFAAVSLPKSVAKIQGWVLRLRCLNLEMELDWLHSLGGTLLIPSDPQWHTGLNDIANPPLALWVLGDPQALADSFTSGSVALVGARAASQYGLDVANELGFTLAQKGLMVVSGGAYGIDAAAHTGALSAAGKTLCVQAGGLGKLYPAMNSSLFCDIKENGAIISELPCSSRPAKRMFLSRNRLIAALAQVTVVVEAGKRSGAISTANHAVEQGRMVAAVPGSVLSSYSAGCHNLIREGATLVTSAAEILELTKPLNPVMPDSAEACEDSFFAGLTVQAAKVLDALPLHHWQSLEQIAREAGLGISTVRSELGILELDGQVESFQGRFRRASPKPS